MGAYVNPVGVPKETWLLDNTELLGVDPPKEFDNTLQKMAVCLVDNGFFTAAGIAYNARELEEFSDPHDKRGKIWFLADTYKLLDTNVSDLDNYLK